MSKIAAPVICRQYAENEESQDLSDGGHPRGPRSCEPVQGSQDLKRLVSGTGIVARLPTRRLLRGYRAAQHELAVARARELVAQPRDLFGCEVAQRRRRLLVVLVLEPREPLGAPQHRRQL